MKPSTSLTLLCYALFINVISGCSNKSSNSDNITIIPVTKNYRLLEKTDSDGTLRYYYGSNGLSKIEGFSGSTLISTATLNYSSNGLISYQVTNNKTSKVEYRLDFQYDSQGKMYQYVKYDGPIVNTHTLEFDSSNRLIKDSFKEGNTNTVSTYEYDTKGNIVKDTQLNGTVVRTAKYDNQVNYRRISKLPLPISDIFDYGSNNVLSVEYYDRTHNPQITSSNVESTFDSDGRIVKDVFLTNGKQVEVRTYKYEQY